MTAQMVDHSADGSLEHRRRVRGLSREALGARAGGISSSTIKRIERGEVVPHPSTTAALAAALGCEPEDLLTNGDARAGNPGDAESLGEGAPQPQAA